MTEPRPHVTDGLPTEALDFRALGAADLPFVRDTWRESYHRAPQRSRMPWAAYKATYCVIIDQLLDREDVWTLGAYAANGDVIGWIAWTPGRLPVVHYAYVRHGARRAGVLTQLMRKAELGARFVYTFRGVKGRGESIDRTVTAALAKRGVSAVHVQIREFLR